LAGQSKIVSLLMTKFVNRAKSAALLRQIDLFLLNFTRAALQIEQNA